MNYDYRPHRAGADTEADANPRCFDDAIADYDGGPKFNTWRDRVSRFFAGCKQQWQEDRLNMLCMCIGLPLIVVLIVFAIFGLPPAF